LEGFVESRVKEKVRDDYESSLKPKNSLYYHIGIGVSFSLLGQKYLR
jgi:hypothetical protein